MQIEVLRTFLNDPEIKEKYGITDEYIKALGMTGIENNIMITLIKELIIKQSEAPSVNVAAAQINALLDNRLK